MQSLRAEFLSFYLSSGGLEFFLEGINLNSAHSVQFRVLPEPPPGGQRTPASFQTTHAQCDIINSTHARCLTPDLVVVYKTGVFNADIPSRCLRCLLRTTLVFSLDGVSLDESAPATDLLHET